MRGRKSRTEEAIEGAKNSAAPQKRKKKSLQCYFRSLKKGRTQKDVVSQKAKGRVVSGGTRKLT